MLRFLNIFTVCILFVFCANAIPIHAENSQSKWYIDECDNLKCNCVKYKNFSQEIKDFSVYRNWSSCKDKTVLKMTANKAVAIYHVDHAEKLQVELYSDNGTFATINNEGNLQIGLQDRTDLSNVFRCHYQQSQDNGDKVYVRNNKTYSLQSSMFGLQFLEDNKIANQDDPYYGINAEFSSDGVNYHSINMHLDKDKIDFSFLKTFHEYYSCELPAGTSHIKLTLYGYQRLPGESRCSDPVCPYLSKVKILHYPTPLPEDPPSSKPDKQPTPQDTPSTEPENDESTTDKDDTTQSYFIKKRVSNGKADHDDRNESEPAERFIIRRRTEERMNINENRSIANNYFNLQKEDKQSRNDEVHNENRKPLDNDPPINEPPNKIQSNEPPQEEGLENKFESLHEEKAEKPSSTAVGLLISSVTIITFFSILIFFKPHKKVDK